MMHVQGKWRLAALCTATLLAGCLSNPVGRQEYAKFVEAPLTDAEFLPSEEEMNNEPIRVVILEGEDGKDSLSISADLGGTLTKTLAGKISERRVEVIDANLAPKLSDALRVAESKGASTYSGPKVASYAIKPTVTAVNVTSSASTVGTLASVASSAQSLATLGSQARQQSNLTSEAARVQRMPTRTYQEKMAKQNAQLQLAAKANQQQQSSGSAGAPPVAQPTASMSHKGLVRAAVNIYTLPDLRLVGSVPIEGQEVLTTPSDILNDDEKQRLVKAAAIHSVEENEHALFNAFVTRGYVGAKKSDGKKSIFLISIGKGAGLKANDKVVIYSRRKATEGLGKKKAVDALEEVMVAEGVVMDNLTEEEAWVHVAEADDAKKVMRGDVIKTEHSESTANKGKKLLKMLM